MNQPPIIRTLTLLWFAIMIATFVMCHSSKKTSQKDTRINPNEYFHGTKAMRGDIFTELDLEDSTTTAKDSIKMDSIMNEALDSLKNNNQK